jgi:hypothetical protein
MQSSIKHLNAILENKTAAQTPNLGRQAEKENDKDEAKKARRKQVIQMAKDLGATTENHKMWAGVFNLTRSECDMDTFEDTDEEERRVILEHLAGVSN